MTHELVNKVVNMFTTFACLIITKKTTYYMFFVKL